VKCNLLAEVTSQALAAALRGTAARQAALANNIANVDTPTFTRTEVEFEQALAGALREARRAPSHCAGQLRVPPPRGHEDHSAPRREDGNNVSIEREMTALARNALAHRAASELLASRIRMLRAVIHGNRRG